MKKNKNKEKIKILFLHPFIPHYREYIFSDLSNHFDVTVGHAGFIKHKKTYKQIYIPIQKLGSINYFQKKLGMFNFQGNFKIFNKYDVIISEMNLRYIDRFFYITMPFRKFAWTCWGIGITSPFLYKKNLIDFFRIKIFSKADSMIFYSKYPLNYYKSQIKDHSKLFIANNTVKTKYVSDKNKIKEIILFVGTLYKEKGMSEVINLYSQYNSASNKKHKLIIIGDGPEKTKLQQMVKDLSLSKQVIFYKSTSDEKILKKFYERAIFSVSLYQSGLSVLNSFAYNTPFVTMHNSATGGERLNIVNKFNGILLKDHSDLLNIMKKTDFDINSFKIMGDNAYETYVKKASYKNMLSNLVLGINYAYKTKFKKKIDYRQ